MQAGFNPIELPESLIKLFIAGRRRAKESLQFLYLMSLKLSRVSDTLQGLFSVNTEFVISKLIYVGGIPKLIHSKNPLQPDCISIIQSWQFFPGILQMKMNLYIFVFRTIARHLEGRLIDRLQGCNLHCAHT